MRILVTGGCGFIGSALVRRLVADGAEVLNLDCLTYAGLPQNVASVADRPGYRFLKADICDKAAMTEAFAGFRPEAVMHLAAESHVDRSIDGPGEFIRTNVTGTEVLLECALDHWRGLDEAARAGFRFLHVSTDEVYGALAGEGHFREGDPYRPTSPYAASKAGADHLVRAFHATYGLPVLITNCGNNYGPFQFPEKLIPVIILNALAGEPLPVYGQGLNVRDWIHVDDHVGALLRVLDAGRPGETYLVGARGERRNIDLVRAICAVLDETPEARHRPHTDLIRFVGDRPGHDFRYAIDPAKIEGELGWRPARSFEDGIRETVRWYLDNRDWIGAVHDRRRLGSAA
ncbi:MAG: dTDP-glucose 4,6-dehydratase [Rhizobiales bacterium NRL2]|jgi:dTDP-glucose 4,6-dehydratase|nr:MAG: dTDP-glucose 4,6-dehydratase [Rhizobiales bacterium NRL2]ANK80024.1 MAG: dTDP-glucose 4,6-dehydratase [Rhizobiales bacterium NRL2]